jgi:hypothetical protein
MRLPQSVTQPLFLRSPRLLTTAILTVMLLGIVPLAASQQQLVCSPASLRFGSVAIGQSETLLVTLTNTGTTSVTVSEITTNNSEFGTSSVSLPLVLAAGASATLSMNFAPKSTGWSSGQINFSSNSSNTTLTLGVGGAGQTSEAIIAAPAAASFGNVAVGSSSTLPVVLTNTRNWKITLNSTAVTGTGFSVTGPELPLTLDSGQSTTFNITFAPKTAGLLGGNLYLYGPALSVPFTGTGTTDGQLTLSPASLNFGSVPDGTTLTLPMTVSAAGASVTISSASSTSSQFVLEGGSFPVTIAVGQSLSYNVAFTPKNSGTVDGSLTFGSNASNSQALVSLSGSGTATQYSVNLYWNASTNVSGYNVYRSTSSNGTYVKINASLDASTAYTDSTVAAGQTYYYAATSVNSSGQESSLSTPPVEAVIP